MDIVRSSRDAGGRLVEEEASNGSRGMGVMCIVCIASFPGLPTLLIAASDLKAGKPGDEAT